MARVEKFQQAEPQRRAQKAEEERAQAQKEKKSVAVSAPQANKSAAKKDFLLELKNEIHDASWNNKAGAIVKSIPETIKKLRIMLASISATSGDVDKIFMDARALLQKAAAQHSADRHEEVQKFYDKSSQTAKQIHLDAKEPAVQSLKTSRSAPELSRLSAHQAEVSAPEPRSATDWYQEQLQQPVQPLKKSTSATDLYLQQLRDAEQAESDDEADYSVDSDEEEALLRTQPSSSKPSSPVAYPDSDDELKSRHGKAVKETKKASNNPFDNEDELKEKFSTTNPFDDDNEIVEQSSQAESKKQFLIDLKSKTRISQWKDKGEGFFSHKVPDTIEKIQTALVKINAKSSEKVVNAALEEVIQLLDNATASPSPGRNKEVHALYKAESKKAHDLAP
jgi:hypothetical protein